MLRALAAALPAQQALGALAGRNPRCAVPRGQLAVSRMDAQAGGRRAATAAAALGGGQGSVEAAAPVAPVAPSGGRVAVAQMTSIADVDANFATVTQLAKVRAFAVF